MSSQITGPSRPPVRRVSGGSHPRLSLSPASDPQLRLPFAPAPAVDAFDASLDALLETVSLLDAAAHLARQSAKSTARAARKRRGSYETPPQLVREVVAGLLAVHPPATGRPWRVLEPAAGLGAFPLGLLEQLPPDIDLDLTLCESDAETLARSERLLGRAQRNRTGGGLTVRPHIGDALLDDALAAVSGTYDLVLGNPPFVASYARDSHEFEGTLKQELRKRFRFAHGRINTAVCFIELGLRALAPGGVIALVLPSGLFHMTSWMSLRQWLISEHELLQVRYCGEWAFAADVPTGVLLVRKRSHQLPLPIPEPAPATIISRDEPALQAVVPPATFLQLPQAILTPYVDPASRQLLAAFERDSVPLGELVEIRDGINLANSKEQLLSEHRRTAAHRPVLRGSDIAPWQVRWGGSYVEYDPAAIEQLSASGGYAFLREPWLFNAPEKLVHRQTADRLIAAIDRERFAVLNSCHLSIPKPALPDPERPGAALLRDPAWLPLAEAGILCALYNSRLLNCYYRLVFCEVEATFPQVKTVNLRLLPIPRFDAATLDAIRHEATLIATAPLPETMATSMERIDAVIAGHLGIRWPLEAPHLAAVAMGR